MQIEIAPLLVGELQRLCEAELGRKLTLVEAEQLGQRMLTSFGLLFEVHQRTGIHRSPGPASLTKTGTNETLPTHRRYAE